MVESSSHPKSDEEYPLLLVSGGGDRGMKGASATVVTPMWDVPNCTTKNTWRGRWPEFVSACWVTFILLGISFLVFYIVGLIPYAQQPYLFNKCNTSKPASDVYYHHVIPYGKYAPFMLYSEYLSHMATQYPLLRFHLYFLMDDTFKSTFPASRYSAFHSRFVPYGPMKWHDDYSQLRDIRFFQSQYRNVNITVMQLSKFMAMTPLKHTWRNIHDVTFYARIFSVWETGGIGIDLTTFTNQYNNRQRPDSRITAILKQHNDGLNMNGYADILSKDCAESTNENEWLMLIERVMNETRSFFDRSLTFHPDKEKQIILNEPATRTHRNKRETFGLPTVNISEYGVTNETLIIPTNTSTNVNVTEMPEAERKDDVKSFVHVEVNKSNALATESSQEDIDKNASDIHQAQIVLIYDLSMLSDIGPSYRAPGFIAPPEIGQVASQFDTDSRNTLKPKGISQYLSIESDGLFVAATLQLHPLLGQIMSTGGRRLRPKFIIQDALHDQCPNGFKDDLYCNNIYII